MDGQVGDIERQARAGRNFDNPPLHLWQPPLSGDIDIVILADGRWMHEGDEIKRDSIVRLFASILRREDDGDYYLVTPAEKWRIRVEAHPLLVTDIDREQVEGTAQLVATLNTGRSVSVGPDCPLYLDAEREHVAALALPNGLSALFTRAAWYRLADMADHQGERLVVHSGGETYDLTA